MGRLVLASLRLQCQEWWAGCPPGLAAPQSVNAVTARGGVNQREVNLPPAATIRAAAGHENSTAGPLGSTVDTMANANRTPLILAGLPFSVTWVAIRSYLCSTVNRSVRSVYYQSVYSAYTFDSAHSSCYTPIVRKNCTTETGVMFQ